jgi:hypothetical protein
MAEIVTKILLPRDAPHIVANIDESISQHTRECCVGY